MSCPLDRCDEHALMFCACPRDSFRDDPALLGYEALELLFGFVIDEIFFVVAETAGAFLSDLSR